MVVDNIFPKSASLKSKGSYRSGEVMLKDLIRKQRYLCLLLFACLIVPCSSKDENKANYRIVSLAPNWTNTVAEIGAKDQLVGVTSFCIYPSDIQDLVAAGELVSIGGFVDVSMSRVDSLKPDLVLTANDMQLQYHDFLIEKGISFIHMEESSLAETYEKILALGEFINKKAEATILVKSIQDSLMAMEAEYANLPEVTVYYEINYAYKCVPGADSYIVELLDIVSANPIFSDRPGIAPFIQWEEVVEANPEVILIPWWETAWSEGTHFEGPLMGYGTTSISEVANRESASSISAVQQAKIRYISSAKTKQAGPMIPVAVRLFAEAIHANGCPERLEMDYVPQIMAEQDSICVNTSFGER
ncbi:MAG TPA: hypothetical protein EYO96_03385 [Candidatus Marinimicrobia bacterium]|nr:hypothetical protein [Candidatus Neomarinimicrobiota bacterium]